MTTAGLTGVSICEAILRSQKKGGALLGKLNRAKRAGLAWLLHDFSVRTNKHRNGRYYYYLYGLERACELSQIALFGDRDWYFEGATILVENQIKGRGRARAAEGRGMGRRGEGVPRAGAFRGGDLPDTCMAILFLKQAAPPLPVITGR